MFAHKKKKNVDIYLKISTKLHIALQKQVSLVYTLCPVTYSTKALLNDISAFS